MNDREINEMLMNTFTKPVRHPSEINPWPLLILVTVVLWVGIWYAAWLVHWLVR